MFSLISMILNIIILIRLYKYDKFYMITYNMQMKEYDYKKGKNKNQNI